MWLAALALTKAVSSRPMAVVRFSRLRSAANNASPYVVTASLTVCQSQASSAATSLTVLPPPTWTVAHLAALVVSKQFLAAMRWSSSIQLRFAQSEFTQRMRCFFQANDMGVP